MSGASLICMQATGEQLNETPGSSIRRPLHVSIHGFAAAPAKKAAGPLEVVWWLLRMVLIIAGLSFGWLVGAQVVRRYQATQAAIALPAAAAASSASQGNSSAQSVEPKVSLRTERGGGLRSTTGPCICSLSCVKQ
jgi:hypothetical protein